MPATHAPHSPLASRTLWDAMSRQSDPKPRPEAGHLSPKGLQRSWATGQRMQWYDGSTFDAQNYVIASTHKKYRRLCLGPSKIDKKTHWSIEGWSFHVIDDSNPRGTWSKLHVSVLLQDHNSPIFSPIMSKLCPIDLQNRNNERMDWHYHILPALIPPCCSGNGSPRHPCSTLLSPSQRAETAPPSFVARNSQWSETTQL